MIRFLCRVVVLGWLYLVVFLLGIAFELLVETVWPVVGLVLPWGGGGGPWYCHRVAATRMAAWVLGALLGLVVDWLAHGVLSPTESVRAAFHMGGWAVVGVEGYRIQRGQPMPKWVPWLVAVLVVSQLRGCLSEWG